MELGDVRKTPFDEIWKNSEVLNKLRTFEFEGNCGKCKYKFSCGGCRARAAYYNDGNYMAEEPWCYIVINNKSVVYGLGYIQHFFS